MMGRLTTSTVLTTVLLATSAGFSREWSDSTGAHRIEADLVSCIDGVAQLKKADGSVVSIAIDRLSVVDREFLKTQANQANEAPRELTAPELVMKVEPAVVRVDVTDALGSGFVVDPSGIVVTNFHVVEGARAATATFKDGASVKIEGYLGVDIAKDIAILKLAGNRQYPTLPLRKELPNKGESVATFGAPQGLDFSVSEGIVAGVRSDKEIEDWFESQGSVSKIPTDAMWVQTTAPISPGNSGGPLVDTRGRAVGANTWAPNEKKIGTVQNLNFAISCQDIARLLSESSGNAIQSLADLPGAAPPTPAITGGALNSSADGFPLVRLPSGASLSYMNVQVPKDWPECNMTKKMGMYPTEFPNGEPKSLHGFLNAELHGPTLVINEDGSKRWAADYREGDRDGILRIWNQGSEMTLFAEYIRGRKGGFVCLFHERLPRLIQEWDKDSKTGEYLIKWTAGVPTILSGDNLPGQAETGELAEAQKLLTKLEEEFSREESDIKRDLTEWFHELDRQIKRQRASVLNVRKRGAIIGTINARAAAEQDAMIRAWRRAMAK